MIIVILWLLLSVAFFGIGEYLSKKFAISPSINLILCIVPMYALGSLAWLPAIHRGKILSTVGTMWNLLSMVITLIVGLIIFKETLTTTQFIGLAFAFIAIILMSA